MTHDFAIHEACPDYGTRSLQLPGLWLKNHRRLSPRGLSTRAIWPRVQATAFYLGGYQLLPYGRLSELFGEPLNAPLSEGTLCNLVKRGFQKASAAMEPIREALIQRAVTHADETGCTLHGQRHWLHVFATEDLTAYHLDAKCGVEAMERMGLIPRYCGLLIHDCLGAYFTFQNCLHGICNAHTQRELTYLHELLEQA
ncbi:MAG: hypothetical protein ACJAXZ_001418 [Akkermansiaceae bacterium]|jgi:transposase